MSLADRLPDGADRPEDTCDPNTHHPADFVDAVPYEHDDGEMSVLFLEKGRRVEDVTESDVIGIATDYTVQMPDMMPEPGRTHSYPDGGDE